MGHWQILDRHNHQEMALGEYESQMELAKYIPDNVVVPLAYGTLENDPSASFFLAIFRNLSEKTATPAQLVDALEKLHNNSVSPNGKFGFHVMTFNGVVPIVNDWCDTWEEYFSRQLRSDIKWEQGIRGPDPEFDAIADEFFQKVIPRLLRPLETGGRSIKPSLVHGDLWQGNAQIDMVTQQLVLFDSCCCYAHNECKLTTRLPCIIIDRD
jgi:fructosamine-3-kinase